VSDEVPLSKTENIHVIWFFSGLFLTSEGKVISETRAVVE
jgi:hypothetical protein